MPFRFVLPSDSNCSAGRISQTKRATSSPAFQNLCGVPAGTTTRCPGPATVFSRPTRKPAEDLEALFLARVNVRRGDEAVGVHERLDHDRGAARVARRLVEDDALSGDGVLDHVACTNHGGSRFAE
jgi:hypothetical protein